MTGEQEVAAAGVAAPRPEPLGAPEGYGFPTSRDGLLDWSVADDLLSRAHTYWLGTVRPDGRPYATPLWAIWVDGAIWFDGTPSTRWARNLAANPQVEIHAEVDRRVVIADGMVEDLETDPATGGRIVAAWNAKYGQGAPQPVERGLFRLRPSTIRAWSESMVDGTRWTLSGSAGP